MNRYVCFFLLSVAFTAANAWTLFGKPSNYDECVIDAIKNKPSKTSGDDDYLTLGLITQSCRKLFPSKTEEKKKCPERELTATEREKLQWGSADITYVTGPYFSTRLYNGNGNISISSASVKIFQGTSDKPTRIQEYDLYVSKQIEPKGTDSLGSTVLEIPKVKWSWKITSVKGCQK